jgi:hypothetical protein
VGARCHKVTVIALVVAHSKEMVSPGSASSTLARKVLMIGPSVPAVPEGNGLGVEEAETRGRGEEVFVGDGTVGDCVIDVTVPTPTSVCTCSGVWTGVRLGDAEGTVVGVLVSRVVDVGDISSVGSTWPVISWVIVSGPRSAAGSGVAVNKAQPNMTMATNGKVMSMRC